MGKFKVEKILTAEKIAIYRAAKPIYNAPGGDKLSAREIFMRASKGILPNEKRQNSAKYTQQLITILRGETPPSTASKVIMWWPSEWLTVIEHYELARSEGKNVRESAIFANSAMPKERQRDMSGQVAPSQISAMSKALAEFQKPTVADPFPNVPLPPPIETPEPAPVVAEPMQTPRVDMAGNMGEAMAGLGPALSVVLTETLKMLGEAVGREIGKHVEAAVESIGTKMQASVAESLYQMRLGLLAGRNPTPTPTVQQGQPLPERKAEPPKPAAGNGYTGRKRVLVIGLLPQQEQMIANENTHLDFKFMSREAPGDRIKHVAQNCDATYVMLNFVSHAVTEALRKPNGGPGYGGVKGMMDALTIRLRDDFPRAGVTRDTPRKQAEAAFASAQH